LRSDDPPPPKIEKKSVLPKQVQDAKPEYIETKKLPTVELKI